MSESLDDLNEQLRSSASLLDQDRTIIKNEVLAQRKIDDVPISSDLTPEEERRVYNELKKLHQVDLNDERSVIGLEDRHLISHMELARRALADQDRKSEMVPNMEDISAQHIKNIRLFSSLVLSMQETNRELICGVEEVFLQSSNATKISKGDKPHSFPDIPNEIPINTKAIAKLSEKIHGAATSCMTVNTNITDIINNFDILRRDCEMVVDSQSKLINYYKDSHEKIIKIFGSLPI